MSWILIEQQDIDLYAGLVAPLQGGRMSRRDAVEFLLREHWFQRPVKARAWLDRWLPEFRLVAAAD
jgi:hypothetical protein